MYELRSPLESARSGAQKKWTYWTFVLLLQKLETFRVDCTRNINIRRFLFLFLFLFSYYILSIDPINSKC